MCSVVSALFKRTSEIQLPLLERVEVGEGVVDEVCREPHCGGGWWFVLLAFLGAGRQDCRFASLGFVRGVGIRSGRERGWSRYRCTRSQVEMELGMFASSKTIEARLKWKIMWGNDENTLTLIVPRALESDTHDLDWFTQHTQG